MLRLSRSSPIASPGARGICQTSKAPTSSPVASSIPPLSNTGDNLQRKVSRSTESGGYEAHYWPSVERHHRDADCSNALQKAKTHESDGNYERAARTFAQALSHLVGAGFNVPMDATQNGGVWQEAYAMLSVHDSAKAMSCANGASRCHLAHGNLTQVWRW